MDHTVRRLLGVGLATLLLVVAAACGSSSSKNGGSSDGGGGSDAKVLGPSNPAKGQPIKIGIVSDGQSPSFDNRGEIDVAQATVKYLNQHKGGIAGHRVTTVACQTKADPAKATDCANQMVESNVVATVVGQSALQTQIWKPLHDAHIPIMTYGASDANVLTDSQTSFVLADPTVSLAELPIKVAKAHHVKKVTVVAVDVPEATAFYKTVGRDTFKKAGMKLDLVTVPLDAADLSPQMQRIASGGPTEVNLIGTDTMCIGALNGLRAANFSGPISLVSQCLTDAVRKAVPGESLKGLYMAATTPVGDMSDPGWRLYQAIVDTYLGGKVQGAAALAPGGFTSVMALGVALADMTGDVTPATVAAKIKAMPEQGLPGEGGLGFRCNGKASALAPAICVRGALMTTLDDTGQPTTYRKLGASPIPD